MKKTQYQGHLFNHHKCTLQEHMWLTLEGHHLNQQISGQLNSLSCHNQIIEQQGNQVIQETQTIMEDNLMYLVLSRVNQ
jgi:hypothetical protein